MASHNESVDPAAEAIQALTGFINTSTLLDLAHRFSATYSDLARTSTDHFLLTPVTALPTGKEQGKFLSIDLGGTNLRVGFVELLGDLEQVSKSSREGESGENVFAKVRRSHDRNWSIGDHLKMDKAEDLFAWIADCIAEVVRKAIEAKTIPAVSEMSPQDEILLGITFSFPMSQISLSEATLLPMGKGFAITSNLNLGKLLLAGYSRHCTPPTSNSHAESTSHQYPPLLPRICVAAITNDTVATFVSLAYAVHSTPNSRVAMGLIVGTGTNATVPMSPSRLHPSKRPAPAATHTVVINTEWTIRGTDAPLVAMRIKTRWDAALDTASDAPGFQPFEYMTAGRYLGEIVRLVYVNVAGGDVPSALRVKNAFPTRFLSEVVARLDLRRITEELERRYPVSMASMAYWTPERVALLQRVAEAVQRRSSALIAAACVGLLHCVGDIRIDDSTEHTSTSNGTKASDIEELVIAYAGGTISQYPKWLETCQAWIDKLVAAGSGANASKRVVLREALDGGIIGAGVLAGMVGDIA